MPEGAVVASCSDVEHYEAVNHSYGNPSDVNYQGIVEDGKKGMKF